MSYIRTKDGIIDLSKVTIGENGWKSVEEYIAFKQEDQEEPIKIADTIEELCDCFIAVDKNGNLCENPMIAKGHCFKSFCNYYKANGIDVDCYLAILTDKGLIYVAKKGELELL